MTTDTNTMEDPFELLLTAACNAHFTCGECDDADEYRRVAAAAKDANDALRAYVTELRNDLETERLRLAACGVAAQANTERSAREQRITPDSPYWSASYADVLRTVDLEIAIRRALFDYHLALDQRQHGDVAADNFVKACETILQSPWERGEALRQYNESRLARSPEFEG